MIIVISAGLYNPFYKERCEVSLRIQCGISDFKHIVVMDNCPTDKVIQQYRDCTEIHQTRHYGSVSNIYHAIKEADPDPEDIILLVDLDDRLHGLGAMYIVLKEYDNDKSLLLTYGSYVCETNPSKKVKFCGEYKQSEDIRMAPWKCSHLKTFKFKLWKEFYTKHLRRLKDHKGEWLQSAGDLAIMMNLFELAGIERTKYISDALYVYNDDNPLNDHKVDPVLQKSTEAYIRSQKPLQRISKW